MTYERWRSIGSSDIAAICGLGNRSAFDVWAAKTDKIDAEPTELMRWGQRLEAGILQGYEETTGIRLEKGETFYDDTVAHFSATPDAIGQTENLIVEAKFVPYGKDAWGEPGTDAVPPEYLLQVQWQMMVCGIPRADVIGLLGGEAGIYHLAYDDELGATLARKADEFWRAYVLAGVAPAITATAGAKAWLKRHFAGKKSTVYAGESLERMAQELLAAEAYRRNWEAECDRREIELKALMGDATRLEGQGWHSTWSQAQPRVLTKWEQAWTEASNLAALHNLDLKPILARYQSQSESSRRFRIQWDKPSRSRSLSAAAESRSALLRSSGPSR